uniref:MULE transposase N-terminal all-beta domain-containing protein n=1 Tax=Brassica oleracea TaxID=3712 RepID=A0A3P6D010_BRAOL|nr:unnamed protein product [Brassica oleracea]
MYDSSSSTTGDGIRVRTPGIPIKGWCGERIKELISKTNLNPYRRYDRCRYAAQMKLENDNHIFKWVDEAFTDEIQQLDYQMCLSSTNIHFDYDGHYSKCGDDYEWIPTDARLYAISFRTSSLEEITYSLLKERICRKMGIDPFTKRLNLSFVPLVVEPKRQSYILDDEDVFVYQTSMDKEQRRNILHLEDIQELEIVQITE